MIFPAIGAGISAFKGARKLIKGARSKARKSVRSVKEGISGGAISGKLIKDPKKSKPSGGGALREVNSLGTSGVSGSEGAMFTSNSKGMNFIKKVPVWGWVVGAVVLVGTLIAIFKKKRRR